MQGIVFGAYTPETESALKVHSRYEAYIRERNVYKRLLEHNIREVRDLTVPQLRNYDDTLLTIEMTFVKPPFILDFGGAYLDGDPEHAQVQDYGAREAKGQEEFEERWGEVNSIRAEFEYRFGIHIVDINPGNIRFTNR